MRWIALLLLLAACGGGSPVAQYTGWAGYINTEAGKYGAFLYLGTDPDGGVYQAQTPGLTGPVSGLPPSITIRPTGCDAGIVATVMLRGDAADLSYAANPCGGAESGSGTLWKFYERR